MNKELVRAENHNLTHKAVFPDIFKVGTATPNASELLSSSVYRPIILSIPEFSLNDGTFEAAMHNSRYDIELWKVAKVRHCRTLYDGPEYDSCMSRI